MRHPPCALCEGLDACRVLDCQEAIPEGQTLCWHCAAALAEDFPLSRKPTTRLPIYLHVIECSTQNTPIWGNASSPSLRYAAFVSPSITYVRKALTPPSKPGKICSKNMSDCSERRK